MFQLLLIISACSNQCNIRLVQVTALINCTNRTMCEQNTAAMELPRGGTIQPWSLLGVARFIDASIYRDMYVSRYYFFLSQICKRYIIISTCDFGKVIPQIDNYFVKFLCEILISRN